MMKSKNKPYVLLVAEQIYLNVCKIKKKNSDLTNINAIEAFIGTEIYNKISSGEFHNELIKKIEKNNFIDPKNKKKFLKKLLDYLKFKRMLQ